jgi:hypothetical protein
MAMMDEIAGDICSRPGGRLSQRLPPDSALYDESKNKQLEPGSYHQMIVMKIVRTAIHRKGGGTNQPVEALRTRDAHCTFKFP